MSEYKYTRGQKVRAINKRHGMNKELSISWSDIQRNGFGVIKGVEGKSFGKDIYQVTGEKDSDGTWGTYGTYLESDLLPYQANLTEEELINALITGEITEKEYEEYTSTTQ